MVKEGTIFHESAKRHSFGDSVSKEPLFVIITGGVFALGELRNKARANAHRKLELSVAMLYSLSIYNLSNVIKKVG